MRLVTISLIAIALTACGPSQEEIDNTAIITCNIMGESRNMDAAMRIREINAAREKIGADPYLGTDSTIKESFEWGLCEELVKNDPSYSELLKAKQILEARRIADEELREKKRIADQELREKKQAALAREKFLTSLEEAVKDSPMRILLIRGIHAFFWFNAPLGIGEDQKVNASFKFADFEASGPLFFQCHRIKPEEDMFGIYETPFEPMCEVSLKVEYGESTHDRLLRLVAPYQTREDSIWTLASVPNGDYVVEFDLSD